jgi:hypothetical protein
MAVGNSVIWAFVVLLLGLLGKLTTSLLPVFLKWSSMVCAFGEHMADQQYDFDDDILDVAPEQVPYVDQQVEVFKRMRMS